MLEHLISASSVHTYETRFRDTGCVTIPKVKGFGKNFFPIMAVFYGIAFPWTKKYTETSSF